MIQHLGHVLERPREGHQAERIQNDDNPKGNDGIGACAPSGGVAESCSHSSAAPTEGLMIQIPRTLSGLIGQSPPMQALVRLIKRVAPAPLTVLIRGERGTGKELVADALQAC
ncbi:MAG: sigma 54-interacting transcriptional regulator [Nitrospinae bacterium]|nr:sigma 54-interacting transcriptional regulator [Nitrospinota bacterium]